MVYPCQRDQHNDLYLQNSCPKGSQCFRHQPDALLIRLSYLVLIPSPSRRETLFRKEPTKCCLLGIITSGCFTRVTTKLMGHIITNLISGLQTNHNQLECHFARNPFIWGASWKGCASSLWWLYNQPFEPGRKGAYHHPSRQAVEPGSPRSCGPPQVAQVEGHLLGAAACYSRMFWGGMVENRSERYQQPNMRWNQVNNQNGISHLWN